MGSCSLSDFLPHDDSLLTMFWTIETARSGTTFTSQRINPSWNIMKMSSRHYPIQPPSMPSLKQLATLPRTSLWSRTPPALPTEFSKGPNWGHSKQVPIAPPFYFRRVMKAKSEACFICFPLSTRKLSLALRPTVQIQILRIGSLLVAPALISWPVVYYVFFFRSQILPRFSISTVLPPHAGFWYFYLVVNNRECHAACETRWCYVQEREPHKESKKTKWILA